MVKNLRRRIKRINSTPAVKRGQGLRDNYNLYNIKRG